MRGLHVQARRSTLRVSREHGHGHQRVNAAHLGHQRVEDGLVAGVAHAVGAADEHSRAASAALALEYLLIHRYLLAAGDVDGVLARGLFKERLAQSAAQRIVGGERGYARAERVAVADLDEIARLAVQHEVRYAAHAGGDRGQAVRRALGYGVGEGLGDAGQRVYVYRAVELVHVVQPAAQRQGVRHAQLPGQGGEVGALSALARDYELYVGRAPSRGGDRAHQCGEVLHRVEPRRRAHDHVARRYARAHALIKGGAVGDGYLAAEVDAVIYGEGVVAPEAARDE